MGVVAITVERGENWGAYINDAKLAVLVDGQPPNIKNIEFKQPGRTSFELSPKEKAQYGTIVDLPAGMPALIQALFVMQQKWWPIWGEAYVFGSTAVPPSS